jgi:hypothetical protein
MKIIKEICNDDYYVQYGINKRKQLGMDLYRAKANVDISKLVPKNVKCVFFTDCKGAEMPKLPDDVEVLFFQKCKFKIFHFPKNLKELYFGMWNDIKTLPDFSNLKNLWSLDILKQTDLRFLPKTLPDSIIFLTLRTNKIMKSSLKSLPKNLEYIYITETPFINNIPDLSYLKKLKQVSIEYEYKSDFVASKKLLEIKGLYIDMKNDRDADYKF